MCSTFQAFQRKACMKVNHIDNRGGIPVDK
jgi:hypothetical protein